MVNEDYDYIYIYIYIISLVRVWLVLSLNFVLLYLIIDYLFNWVNVTVDFIAL